MGLFSKKEYKAVINYIDLDNDLMSIGSSTEVTGQEGDSIDFDPTNEIKLREREGYVLVKDKFSEGKERTFTNDTQVFLITFKHGERPVNPEHPLTKIPTEEYKKPITFTVKFENTPTKIKDNVQVVNNFRTLTADKVTGERIKDGQFDTDWGLEKEKFEDVELPILPSAHTDKKVVTGPKVGDEDIEVTVKYEPNGFLIPVDENGEKIPDVGPYQFATDEYDPTKVAKNQIVPDIPGYTHAAETISPGDPENDLEITYEKIPVQEEMVIKPNAVGSGAEVTTQEQSDAVEVQSQSQADIPVAESTATSEVPSNQQQAGDEKGIDLRFNEQMAIVNYIDLDNEGKQITSSGPLYGLPGEIINNLYSTRVPMNAIEEAGFEVVFNNFDGNGQQHKFNDTTNPVTQVFTIGLCHKDSKETPVQIARRKSALRSQLDAYNDEVKIGDNDAEAVITVANATMKLLSSYIKRTQNGSTEAMPEVPTTVSEAEELLKKNEKTSSKKEDSKKEKSSAKKTKSTSKKKKD